MKPFNPLNNEQGVVLVTSLLFLAMLSVLGSVAYLTSSVEVMIAGNYKTSREAFYAAEAGMQEGLNRLNLNSGDANFIGEAPGGTPTPGWGRYIVVQTASDGAYPEMATLQTIDGNEIDYLVKIYYKMNGANVVLYGQDFGYGGDAPATGVFPVIVITSNGFAANNSNRTLTVEISKLPLDISADAALASDDAVTVSGSSLVSGFNHDITTTSADSAASPSGIDGPLNFDNNGVFNNRREDDTPGGYESSVPYGDKIESSGHKPGIWTTGDTAQSGGSNETWGGDHLLETWQDDTAAPSAWKTLAILLGISDNALLNVLNSADVTITNTSGGNNHLDAAPQGIIYIDGDLTITNSTPSNNDGWGLMYVTGDLDSSQLDFKGLIYVEGEIKITGNFWILGSLVAKNSGGGGPTGAGNGTVLYSSDALEQKVGESMKYFILSWLDESFSPT